MIRYFENKTENIFWKIEIDYDIIIIHSGEIGTEGDLSITEDAYTELEMPTEVLFDSMVTETRNTKGFEEVLVDNLLEHIEKGHDIKLKGRLKKFYDDAEYKQYQGKTCPPLKCKVDFASAGVQGYFDEEYYNDDDNQLELIPIASKIFGDYEDEQQWIGIDPNLEDTPVYGLYTSGDYEVVYDNIDAFLADLR